MFGYLRSAAALATAALVAAGALAGSASAAPSPAPCEGWMMSLRNASFEDAPDGAAVPGWCQEGPDSKGTNRSSYWSRTGASNAYIQALSAGKWNSITQSFPLLPGRNYELHAWVKTSENVRDGYFGVRGGRSPYVRAEVKYGPHAGYRELVVPFASGTLTEVTAFAGFWSPGGLVSWIVIDDLWLRPL